MKSLGRKTSLRRTRFRKQTVHKLTAAEIGLRASLALAFHDAAASKGYCAICHVRPEYLHSHHLIEASFLRKELRNVVDPLRLEAIAFDIRNSIPACDSCHMNHHWSGAPRIFRKHIPESAYEFAKELDVLTGDERFTVRLEQYREAA